MRNNTERRSSDHHEPKDINVILIHKLMVSDTLRKGKIRLFQAVQPPAFGGLGAPARLAFKVDGHDLAVCCTDTKPVFVDVLLAGAMRAVAADPLPRFNYFANLVMPVAPGKLRRWSRLAGRKRTRDHIV